MARRSAPAPSATAVRLPQLCKTRRLVPPAWRASSLSLCVSPWLRKTYHAGQGSRSGGLIVRATTKLRALLNSGRIAVAPGAFDGLSARLVEQAGFPAIYASGGAIARSAGVPDLGLLSV
ncbi:MAG: isocitrate lyase/phosphoenolpyruvate mutase family protein, partial [Xanthobacteraceae bacterium]